MNAAFMLCLLSALLAQNDVESTVPETPERIRVLAIAATGDGAGSQTFDTSMAPVEAFLEKLPYTTFRELGFHDETTPYGETTPFPLHDDYRLFVAPQRLTESDEVVLEAYVEMKDGDGFVEALRVTGRSERGKGMVFRGFPLPGGEMVVVLSVAEAQEDRGDGGGTGGSEAGQSGSGDSGSETPPGDAPGSGAGDQQPMEESEEGEPDPHATDEEEDDSQANLVLAPAEEGEDEPERETPVPPELANLEGILRTLEEIDRREQAAARGRRFDTQVQGDWW